MVTDNGTEFDGDFEKMCKSFGLKHIRTSAYHPQANGLVERFNGVLKRALYRLCENHPSSWPHLIPRVLRASRATRHSTTGLSPSEYLMGTELGALGLETLAWQPYLGEEPAEATHPQGAGWYGHKVQKLFFDPVSKALKLFEGTVVLLSISPEGAERLRVVYTEDKDVEVEEVCNILPWWRVDDDQTLLEAISPIDSAGFTRIQHILYTMLAEKTGPLHQLALELIERHPAYADLPNHAPARGPDRTPPWLAKTGQDARSQVTDFLAADEHQRLGTIAKKGFMRTQASQQKQVRAYARRRRPAQQAD